MQLFSVATGARAARQAARFLLAYGHRRVAYISPFNRASWSQDRLDGLREVLHGEAVKGHVGGFVLDADPLPGGYHDSRMPTADAYAPIVAIALGKDPGTRERTSAVHLLEQTVHQLADNHALRVAVSPLFEQALADTTLSAWVCVNDRIAVLASDFLRRRNPPKTPALVSFDDTYDAFALRLPSFNFNIAGLVSAMFGFVLSPSRFTAYRRREPVQIEGTIAARGMTRAP